jgi:3-hydroxyacyl-CoA dehydrogenase
MFAVFVEVDNSGEARDDRLTGLREELAPAMKQTHGFQSGVFTTNDLAGAGMMLVVYDTRENAAAVAGRLSVGAEPRPGVTIKRVEVVEVIATA